jgi:hypothetical protein
MILRLLLTLLLFGAGGASAQTSTDSVVDVPLSVPSQRSGVVPTTLLPLGALRIEGGGVRLPGQPPPPAPEVEPPAGTSASGALAPPPVRPGRKDAPAPAARGADCVGRSESPLQVQLGAVDGRAAADKEADRLMRRHGDILGSRPTPTDCSSPRTNLFRIRLGVPTAAEGNRVCNELAGRGERCIVVRANQ